MNDARRTRRSRLSDMRVVVVTSAMLLAIAGCMPPTRATPREPSWSADRIGAPVPAPESPGPGTSPSPGTSTSPIPGTSPAVTFPTLGPGTALPDDGVCAEQVGPAPEVVPENVAYNATAGSQRLPADFFPPESDDPRSAAIAERVSGAYTGSTTQILRWVACKWGIDESIVRAQSMVESSWRQAQTGDWTRDPRHCAPDHGLGVDGRPGECPESWGVMQLRYRYFSGAFPDAIRSTSFNADTAYAVWRSCFEGYEWWLRESAPADHPYAAGDLWGCIGRHYSGDWYSPAAVRYIALVRQNIDGRTPC